MQAAVCCLASLDTLADESDATRLAIQQLSEESHEIDLEVKHTLHRVSQLHAAVAAAEARIEEQILALSTLDNRRLELQSHLHRHNSISKHAAPPLTLRFI